MNDYDDGIYTIWLSYEDGEEIAISLDTRKFRAALRRAEAPLQALTETQRIYDAVARKATQDWESSWRRIHDVTATDDSEALAESIRRLAVPDVD